MSSRCPLPVASDVVLAADESAALQGFHERVVAQIEERRPGSIVSED